MRMRPMIHLDSTATQINASEAQSFWAKCVIKGQYLRNRVARWYSSSPTHSGPFMDSLLLIGEPKIDRLGASKDPQSAGKDFTADVTAFGGKCT